MHHYTPWPDEDDELVRVHTVRAAQPSSTIAIGEGLRVGDDYAITFAADWRPMLALAAAISRGVEPLSTVPRWAILSALPPEAAS